MKSRLILTFLMIHALLANAQLMQFQQGKNYFMEDDYVKALEYFNQAIAQERSGNKDLLTEAYYLRGLTWIRLHGEAYSGDNLQDQKRYVDALLNAYRDLKLSLEHDNGQYWKQIDMEIKNLHHPLLQEGLKSLNEYNDQVYLGKPVAKVLDRAEEYLEAAHEIRDSYLVNDLLGQVALDRGEQESARGYFRQAITLYTAQLPEEPDFLMAYVYYRLAALYKSDSISQAMQEAQDGIRMMEQEYRRFSEMKGRMGPKRADQMEEDYRLAMKDLQNLELDLYLSDPSKYVEALAVFERKVAASPDDVSLLLGYASLLEQTDKTRAMMTYEQILALDSTQEIALFNLGALYYGNAKQSLELAQKTPDDQQFALLMEDAVASFEQAKPYFERVLVLDPGSLDAVRALKTIAFVTDDRAAYDRYDEQERQIELKQK